mgnify:CR=1 FL=1
MRFLKLLLQPFTDLFVPRYAPLKEAIKEEEANWISMFISLPICLGFGWLLGKFVLAKGWITGFWSTLFFYTVSFFSGMFIYAFIRTLVLIVMGVDKKAPEQPKPKKNGKVVDAEATVK